MGRTGAVLWDEPVPRYGEHQCRAVGRTGGRAAPCRAVPTRSPPHLLIALLQRSIVLVRPPATARPFRAGSRRRVT